MRVMQLNEKSKFPDWNDKQWAETKYKVKKLDIQVKIDFSKTVVLCTQSIIYNLQLYEVATLTKSSMFDKW